MGRRLCRAGHQRHCSGQRCDVEGQRGRVDRRVEIKPRFSRFFNSRGILAAAPLVHPFDKLRSELREPRGGFYARQVTALQCFPIRAHVAFPAIDYVALVP